VLGILGAGVQARAHIRALSRVKKIERIKIYSPSGTSAAAIKKDLEPAMKIAIDVAGSAADAVRDTDLLVTGSTAKDPIVKSEWLKTGVHINAVGSHRPDYREIDGATIARARVVVDSRAAIMAECGDILLAIKEKSIGENAVHAEIGEVLGGAKSGRTSATEITLYKSVGIAIQDVATANLVYRKARERGIGTNVEI
jgi:ornithine cyclodeaminase/alanine dehydrogenase-like protein (mu-crystallin family)